ncbi:DNA repair ATPase [Alkalimarinus alittae]|uniref:DNA repair ATPase n=1 Tax=Alkalimarinus alittae TaxID=2961619 RepID=A0ABY6N2G1_9ALTE|nr:DNA repair ATPase [Alkalimarinus alittae]UZE96197.1 DNA repair ATPase [Alkalimarinus alittae]
MAQQNQSTGDSNVENAVAAGGAYEVIRKRLSEQGKTLNQLTRHLNESRLEEFGSSDMSVVSRVRVRTENNSVARDMVQVGDYLLFGYNVFLGLKKETKIEDVFSLFRLKNEGDHYDLEPADDEPSFLTQASFVSDFDELYRYYKHTRLVELSVKNGKLLAGFQIGERLEDLRVFRWSVSADGKDVQYIDSRGERDIQLPPAYDFEWTGTTREDSVNGRHPHINILDKVFVETVGGDLTVKIENNTEDGLGIYREPVEDDTQSIDDADYFYAELGGLILLKIKPYREETWRHLIFNTMTEEVLRIDAIGQSCVQLPEDHGVIFPGGYYLQTGEYKTFEQDSVNSESGGLKFKQMIRSPNGEDVLYVFYEPEEGVVGLFAYNLISKELQNPIYGHGYALSDAGKLVVFSAESEPTRIHPMQIWQTPFVSQEFASKAEVSQSFFGRIGNAALVRGVSDLYSVCRLIDNQSVSSKVYEELSKTAAKIFDAHYWIADYNAAEQPSVESILKEITQTSELVIDEFEKVESIRRQSQQSMTEAEAAQNDILLSIRPENWEIAEEYVQALDRLRHQRGHLATIKELRYIDLERIAALDEQLVEAQAQLSEQTVTFLSNEEALTPYLAKIDELNKEVDEAETIASLTPLIETIESTASGLDLLSELMASLKVDDATVRTRIIDSISEVYSKLNQSKATARHKQKNLGSEEAIAQFGAQFKLFSQSITNALGMANTPERCDEQLSRLLVQLEELESQFSEYDQFLSDIMAKREEIYESFESHKQQLLDERQRKAQSVTDAADRILASIERRSLKFTEADELNTYFASDALVLKTREMVERLRALDSAVKADDVESRFKSIKEQALRSLRDKTDIYEEGGKVIKLGPRHKFSVNTQALDLTILPRNGELNVHLTGTDFFEPLTRPELLKLRPYWDMTQESETPSVYRAEYLASLMLQAADKDAHELSHDLLREALLDQDQLLKLVRDFATPRYKEGYQKGIHDHDAVLLLQQLIPAMDSADLLKFDPLCRALAQVFWANTIHAGREDQSVLLAIKAKAETWHERAQSAANMLTIFNNQRATQLLIEEAAQSIRLFIELYPIDVTERDIDRAAEYLVAELSRERVDFISSKYAQLLVDELKRTLDDTSWRKYQSTLEKLKGQVAERWNLSASWLIALVEGKQLDHLVRYIPEAIALVNADGRLERRPTEVDVELTVSGLLGDHPRIQNQQLSFALDEFFQRLDDHQQRVVKGYHDYLALRQSIIDEERDALRLETFKPKPLSSFVRNRLINESYLPLIGDNLAKQMGTIGENKRSDLMGLLMMISPPGYGKTTLMEYVASRLGLIFMKINCPSLGHDVLSLDPEQAPNATARQELEKLNLGLEMGNNVMLYLDDIQHTHPEFLQKFISLCDGTRRIEGIWKGQTKTYDMRGKKFCVVMAGNPYTESGEAFKVPDMLANRADIYNLGDILGGMDEQFALSYIENSLTSNPVLAPLATRDMDDTYKLVKLAQGESIATTDLKHQYSGAEVNEITGVLKKLFTIQEIILKINQQYIASAAQDDTYRTEPSFKLQGSYRNMNKMAEKVSSVMNQDELMQMISDHYLGESQLLTSGAEENLLKLAELRGNMTDEERQRWAQIKKDFLRNKAMGGDDADVGGKVIAQLVDLVDGVKQLGHAAESVVASNELSAGDDSGEAAASQQLDVINSSLNRIGDVLSEGYKAIQNQKPEAEKVQPAPNVEVINQPVPGLDKVLHVLANTMENSIFPLVRAMDKKIDIDLRTHDKMAEISTQLRQLESELKGSNE